MRWTTHNTTNSTHSTPRSTATQPASDPHRAAAAALAPAAGAAWEACQAVGCVCLPSHIACMRFQLLLPWSVGREAAAIWADWWLDAIVWCRSLDRVFPTAQECGV